MQSKQVPFLVLQASKCQPTENITDEVVLVLYFYLCIFSRELAFGCLGDPLDYPRAE